MSQRKYILDAVPHVKSIFNDVLYIHCLILKMLINTLQTSFPSAQIYLAHKNSVVSWSKAMKQCVLQQYENNDTDKETLDLKRNKF